jgi:hypothetical protein
MTFLFRPWLAPSPPVVFDPLNIGIAFLVNIGYGGPVARTTAPLFEALPARRSTAGRPSA